MTDFSIRRVTIAEQAEAAARRFIETGERQDNPHRGTPDERTWQFLFLRWCDAIQLAECTEASA